MRSRSGQSILAAIRLYVTVSWLARLRNLGGLRAESRSARSQVRAQPTYLWSGPHVRAGLRKSQMGFAFFVLGYLSVVRLQL